MLHGGLVPEPRRRPSPRLTNAMFGGLAALCLAVGCGESKTPTELFRYCMNAIYEDEFSSPACKVSANDRCTHLSQGLPFVTRARAQVADLKAFASAFVDFEPWTYADCVAVHESKCVAAGQMFPCHFEACFKEIPGWCREYAQ